MAEARCLKRNKKFINIATCWIIALIFLPRKPPARIQFQNAALQNNYGFSALDGNYLS